MGLFGFGKRGETFLAVITSEGPGRLRINGLRSRGAATRRAALAHGRTVCWVEFSPEGGVLDRGLGQAGAGREGLLRELPGDPTVRGVLQRLRDGRDSVGKWLDLGASKGR